MPSSSYLCDKASRTADTFRRVGYILFYPWALPGPQCIFLFFKVARIPTYVTTTAPTLFGMNPEHSKQYRLWGQAAGMSLRPFLLGQIPMRQVTYGGNKNLSFGVRSIRWKVLGTEPSELCMRNER